MFYEDFFVPIPLFALNFHGGKGREKHERKDPKRSRFRVVVGGRAGGPLANHQFLQVGGGILT